MPELPCHHTRPKTAAACSCCQWCCPSSRAQQLRLRHAYIAKFISGLGEQIKPLFTQVLMVCDAQGLIGGELFAIDGVKLPSNASKERSGTH